MSALVVLSDQGSSLSTCWFAIQHVVTNKILLDKLNGRSSYLGIVGGAFVGNSTCEDFPLFCLFICYIFAGKESSLLDSPNCQ